MKFKFNEKSNKLWDSFGDDSNVSTKGNSMNNLKYDEINQYHYNDEYIFFTKSFLSQWYGAFPGQQSTFSVSFNFDISFGCDPNFTRNISFNCAEQAMMYAKAILFKDYSIATEILNTTHPRNQKDLGRQVKGFDDKIWDYLKRDIVTWINHHKFEQNEYLKEKLLSTHPKKLVEAAPWDRVWGIGMGVDDPDILNESKWKGTNLLGLSVMHVRLLILRDKINNQE